MPLPFISTHPFTFYQSDMPLPLFSTTYNCLYHYITFIFYLPTQTPLSMIISRLYLISAHIFVPFINPLTFTFIQTHTKTLYQFTHLYILLVLHTFTFHEADTFNLHPCPPPLTFIGPHKPLPFTLLFSSLASMVKTSSPWLTLARQVRESWRHTAWDPAKWHSASSTITATEHLSSTCVHRNPEDTCCRSNMEESMYQVSQGERER